MERAHISHPQTGGGTGDVVHDGDSGPLGRVHPQQEDALPDPIPVQRTHTQVEEEVKEAAGGDPDDDCDSAEGNRHEQGPTKRQPALFLALRDNLALDLLV